VRIGIYCGSARGVRPEYAAAAGTFARALAARGVEIVYGGASIGLMGVVADAALEAGGRVTGVIPRLLMRSEVAHGGPVSLVVTESMHERKARMAELSDAFVALPGGAGTLDEIFEMWTWAQLGLHRKPCWLLDVAGYFEPLVSFLDRAVREGFVRPETRALLAVATDPRSLAETLSRSAASSATPAR
jgi:hypothetical protein